MCAMHAIVLYSASLKRAIQRESLVQSKGVVGDHKSEGSGGQSDELTNRNMI
jgi:hypothetical protein